jgi:hypothetical protein
MSFVEVLRQATTRLEKSEIQYMVTGSIAASYYGLTRATEDLDIVISADPEKLRTFMGLFPSDEYYAPLQDALEAHRHQSMFNVLDMVRSWKIDLMFQKSTPFHREAFQRRRTVTFEGVGTTIISVEDLIISKLEWSKMGESERQARDAGIVAQKRQRELDRDYVERWVKVLGLSSQWNSARRLGGLE